LGIEGTDRWFLQTDNALAHSDGSACCD
jgi:hypothetical protein